MLPFFFGPNNQGGLVLSAVDSEGINPCLLLPPSPRSFGIIGLGGKFHQVFEFKGLAGKVFQNQRLRLSKSAENGFGAVSRAVLVDGYTSELPQSDLYRGARRGLKSMDFEHGEFVMKKSQASDCRSGYARSIPRLEKRETRGTRQSAVTLYVAFHNFCRVHQTVNTTPAMAAGLTDHVWTIAELLTVE